MRTMIFEKLPDINICHAISIGQHESIPIEVFLYSLDTSSCHSIQTGIYQSHLPWFQDIIMYDHLVFLCKIKGNITVVKIIICKPFLDYMLLISTADHKFIKAICRIHFHDMPENRLLSDLDHRLRFQMALLTDTGPKTTC